ncbi:hypothetical protein [Actinoplanes sp. ATCC 53533]|nr:hypothetical protein [Actinoplanes sp. ATCC 53533]
MAQMTPRSTVPEPQLESRGRLPDPPAAPDGIGRSDLAALPRDHQAPG